MDPTSPKPGLCLAIRTDYIHEAKLNAVVDAIRHIIPGTMLESTIKKGNVRL